MLYDFPRCSLLQSCADDAIAEMAREPDFLELLLGNYLQLAGAGESAVTQVNDPICGYDALAINARHHNNLWLH